MSTVLGLDPSTSKFGFAFASPDWRVPKSGTWRLFGADEMFIDRTLGVASESVSALCKLIKCERVVIEAPIIFMANESSAHTLAALIQLSGAVRAAAYRAGCDVRMVAASKVRKYFLNVGRPENPKRAVQARCTQLGWEFGDEHAADALAVLAWGLSDRYPDWRPALGTPLFSVAAA